MVFGGFQQSLAGGTLRFEPLTSLADQYLGIPYRSDGAIDARGRYVTFNNPDREFLDPGLNCSGFVVDFARKALGRTLPLRGGNR